MPDQWDTSESLTRWFNTSEITFIKRQNFFFAGRLLESMLWKLSRKASVEAKYV